MKVNSNTLAKQIAAALDEKDKQGKNGKIEASVWNQFVQDKGGKQISNFININDAVKSLVVYLYRQAKSKGQFIAELGQEWINNLASSDDNKVTDTPVSQNSKKTKKSNVKKEEQDLGKKVDTSYSRISREQALKRAKNDKRLERLSGGRGWSVSEGSFVTDIPYARKHTGEILSFVSSIIGENIVVTSALGTGGTRGRRSPHWLSENYCTHHNAENPKLDIKTNGHSGKLRKKLISTGLFSRVSVEPDHLDIQIKNEVYLAFERGHNMNNILASAKKNSIGELLA